MITNVIKWIGIKKYGFFPRVIKQVFEHLEKKFFKKEKV